MQNNKIPEEKRINYFLRVHSLLMPFSVHGRDFSKIEEAEMKLQDFIKYLEKKFDTIWYIGSDMFDNEIYERFMFHHGGFMEVSLKGELKCFFAEDKCLKMQKAISYALGKMCNKRASAQIINRIVSGQKLINLKDVLEKEIKP